MEIFAERLKELRNENNLSQAKLAKELNVDCSTIAKYETCKISPSVEMLILIARYFKVSVSYLLGEE